MREPMRSVNSIGKLRNKRRATPSTSIVNPVAACFRNRSQNNKSSSNPTNNCRSSCRESRARSGCCRVEAPWAGGKLPISGMKRHDLLERCNLGRERGTEALIPELVGLPHLIYARCVLNGECLWLAHFSPGRNTLSHEEYKVDGKFKSRPHTYDREEPAVSYRWMGWVWEITGWSWRLQEDYRSF